MSTRALRKTQKKNDLAIPDLEESPSSENESSSNLFCMLNDAIKIDDIDEDESKSETLRNVADKPIAAGTQSRESAGEVKEASKGLRGSKRARKRGKHRTQTAEVGDEIDRALAELSVEEKQDPEERMVRPSLASVLAVDTRQLDSDAEMRKLFGRKVVGGESKRQVPRKLTRRSTLAQPKDNWPPLMKGGLSMELLERKGDVLTFKFVHPRTYQEVQRQFHYCVRSYDPQNLIDLLRFNPYHIDTLLQVSEILKHQGDHTASGELIERALYAFDCSSHSLFNISSGNVRLPFRYSENRPFYLALFKHISNLARRGTWKTAFQFVKLLLSLDPEADPYGALLMIDAFALKAKQSQYLLDLCQCAFFEHEAYFLPNLQFSVALAMHITIRSDEAKEQMSRAFSHFPWLANEVSLAINGRVCYDNIVQPTERQNILAALYMERSKQFWIETDAEQSLADICSRRPSVTTIEDQSNVDLSLARHIVLTESPSLIALLPKDFTSRSNFSNDPLPPPDSVVSYQDSFETRAPTMATSNDPQSLIRSFFSSLLPWRQNDNSQERLDRMLAAAEVHPGGQVDFVNQFAEGMALEAGGNLPTDLHEVQGAEEAENDH